MAPGSILLRPDPVDGLEFMKKRPNPPIELDWKSAFTILSASGELGPSTGPWIRRSKAGQICRALLGPVFRSGASKRMGQWRVEFDHGISHDGHDGMKEALTAIDLADLARAGGNVNTTGAAAPRPISSPPPNAKARWPLTKDFCAANSRLLRDEMVPIVDSTPSVAIANAESRYDWTPVKTVSAKRR